MKIDESGNTIWNKIWKFVSCCYYVLIWSISKVGDVIKCLENRFIN